MKNISNYLKEFEQYRDVPHSLADMRSDIGVDLAYKQEQMRQLQLAKAVFRTNKKFSDGDKPLSDTAVNDMWLQTDEGKKELSLKYIIKSLVELKGVLKDRLKKLEEEKYQ